MNTHILRPCRESDSETMLTIINSAARAYHGVIPADCWHEPYMGADELHSEIATGVSFHGCEVDARLAGVMGIQTVQNVDLIRHAYVLPTYQGHGIGGALMAHLRATTHRPLLVGTWQAATWAIGFYERLGLQLVPEISRADLLRTYWTVSARQIETSVVLASPAITVKKAAELMAAAGGS